MYLTLKTADYLLSVDKILELVSSAASISLDASLSGAKSVQNRHSNYDIWPILFMKRMTINELSVKLLSPALIAPNLTPRAKTPVTSRKYFFNSSRKSRGWGCSRRSGQISQAIANRAKRATTSLPSQQEEAGGREEKEEQACVQGGCGENSASLLRFQRQRGEEFKPPQSFQDAEPVHLQSLVAILQQLQDQAEFKP